MLARENRLTGDSNFATVKKKGTLYQCPDVGVVIYNRNDDSPTRFGSIISTKISKMAVHRNRVARSLREAARQNLTRIGKGYDIVFLAKKTITNKTTDEIMSQIHTLFAEVFVK